MPTHEKTPLVLAVHSGKLVCL